MLSARSWVLPALVLAVSSATGCESDEDNGNVIYSPTPMPDGSADAGSSSNDDSGGTDGSATDTGSDSGGGGVGDASSETDSASDAPVDTTPDAGDSGNADGDDGSLGAHMCSPDGGAVYCMTYCTCMETNCPGSYANHGACINACGAFSEEQLCCRYEACSAAVDGGSACGVAAGDDDAGTCP